MVTPTNAAFSEGPGKSGENHRDCEGMRQHRHMSEILSRRQSLWAIFFVHEDKTRSPAQQKNGKIGRGWEKSRGGSIKIPLGHCKINPLASGIKQNNSTQSRRRRKRRCEREKA